MSRHSLGSLEPDEWGTPSPATLSFPRNKTGILGWRSEKTEMVNGYEAKVRPQLPGARPCQTLAYGELGSGSLRFGGAKARQHGGKGTSLRGS